MRTPTQSSDRNPQGRARIFASHIQAAVVIGMTIAAAANTAFAQNSDSMMESGDSMATAMTFPERFKKQVVEGSQIHGRVGIYDFRRWHDTNQPYPGQPQTTDDFNTEGTTYGAQIQLQTGQIYGLSAGLGVVYESSFYGNNADKTRLNCNLACDGAVQNITQGYLQYNGFGAQIRAGRQLINTPLAGADQFTFLPRSFQGVSGTIRPLEMMQMGGTTDSSSTGPQVTKPPLNDAQPELVNFETDQYMPMSVDAPMTDIPEWQLFAAKINRYEGRGNADRFVQNNRYFTDVAGFWTAGTTFNSKTEGGQFIGQYYHYTFQETENAEYAELGYMTPTIGGDSGPGGYAPYVRAQYIHAYDVDNSRVEEGIKSDIFGLKLGVSSSTLGFSIFGNFSPLHSGSFNDGQLLHPYTDLSGVIYTDTMNNGIQEIGPGWAAGARFDLTPTDNFSMYARYVQYEAKNGHYHDFYFNGGPDNRISDDSFVGEEVENQQSHAIGVGLNYDLGGIWSQLAGLNIGDNLGITYFDGAPNFYDNRIRFYYSF